MKEKTKMTLVGIEIAICVVLAGAFYAKAQYFQGRIDATREAMEIIETLKSQIN